MTWMVTGGAGYIGGHIVRALAAEGLPVAVLDDYSTGMADFVPADVQVARCDVLDTGAVEEALRTHNVTGVIHCAAFKFAGESVDRPLHTYRQNTQGTLSLLSAMDAAGVARLVFSGTAAVYGTPTEERVNESTATSPESPYGASKLAAEWAIRDYAAGRERAGLPFAHTTLRYFNVIGSADGSVYDAGHDNVVPRAFDMIVNGDAPVIFGTDYDTPDGTCVRDYIEVGAVARAHVAAARAMDSGSPVELVYNLGSGSGTSVREIMSAIVEASGTDLVPTEGKRRDGDPVRIVADGVLAARDLGWATDTDYRAAVAAAWAARPS